MIFSKACEYGIRATVYITKQSINQSRASLKAIAKEINSPEAFTAKILQKLVRAGIINSIKGSAGGFNVDLNSTEKIRLIDIVLAIDGGLNNKVCVLGFKECSEINQCPVHHKYKHIKKDIESMLQNTSLFEMSNSVDEGLSYLKG